MIYIVNENFPQGKRSEFAPAYSFLGEPKEVEALKECAASTLLGAVACEVVKDEAACSLLSSLASNNHVLPRDQAAFNTVMDHNANFDFRAQREENIYDAVSSGRIALRAALDELNILNNEATHPDNVSWMDTRGLHGVVGDGQFALRLRPIESGEVDKVEMELIRNSGLPINAVVHQFEYLPPTNDRGEARIHSDYVHQTFGTLHSNGTFEPLMTILGFDHPLRDTGEEG